MIDLDLYQLLNISRESVESKIQRAISETKEQLSFLPIERTCVIYSNYLYNNLRNKHVVLRLINTEDLGIDYKHHFLLVSDKRSSYYLADLTYGQFGDDEYLSKLVRDGYEEMDELKWAYYLSRFDGYGVCSLDQAFDREVPNEKVVSK